MAEAEGAAAVSLHARTADQLYTSPVAWEAVGQLAAALAIPVLGNGDIYEAGDALRLMRSTGAAGVLIGRCVTLMMQLLVICKLFRNVLSW